MVKVEALLDGVIENLESDDGKLVSSWLKCKMKEIRSCEKTLSALRDEFERAMNQDVEEFADYLADDEFEY